MNATQQPIENEADTKSDRARVVIADDGPLVRALFRRILERSVAADVVAEAGDGEEAIAAVAVHQPDLLLLDVAMPKVDGLSAIPEIRRQSPHTRIVLLSGFEGWQLDREAHAHAADGYIEKQLDPDSLVAKLRDHCRAACSEREGGPVLSLAAPTADEYEVDNTRLLRLASVAAHDLRAPVQLITGFGQLLADTHADVLDEHGKEFLGWILDAAGGLDRMISDMLDYVVADTREPEWVTVDLDELFASLRLELQPELVERRVALTWSNLPTIVGDVNDVTRILTNLVRNAMTFVAPGVEPCIHVSAERVDHAWIISVADNAIGVPPTEAHAIFGGLHRLHPKDAYPGTGVGLAICKKLVTRRGGEIGVTARSEGGSRFWFSVPDSF